MTKQRQRRREPTASQIRTAVRELTLVREAAAKQPLNGPATGTFGHVFEYATWEDALVTVVAYLETRLERRNAQKRASAARSRAARKNERGASRQCDLFALSDDHRPGSIPHGLLAVERTL